MAYEGRENLDVYIVFLFLWCSIAFGFSFLFGLVIESFGFGSRLI